MSDALAVCELELTRTWQSRAAVLAAFITPLAWLLLFGLAFDQGLGVRVGAIGYMAFISPGLVAMLGTFSSLGSGQGIGRDRDTGFLKEMLVAPVSRLSLVAGRGMSVALLALGQALLVLVLVALVGGGLPLPYGALSVLGAAAVLGLLCMGFLGAGLAIAVRSPNATTYQATIGVLTLPMFFLSGALVPISKMPAALQAAAYVNPMAYGIDALRTLLLGEAYSAFPLPLAVLALCGFALFTLGFGARNLTAKA
ncbi:MAG: ABC transporter permease [Halobacteriales archaeon]|nr:ABC transporter permease [Halobacteriales archaeon]